jgi:hypothetical protein
MFRGLIWSDVSKVMARLGAVDVALAIRKEDNIF